MMTTGRKLTGNDQDECSINSRVFSVKARQLRNVVLGDKNRVALDDDEKSPKEEDIWSLAQIAALEAINAVQNIKETRYTFRATIHCISPILDQSFRLVELIDDEHSCVAVLRKPMELLLKPGDTIVLHNVKRQRWKVSQVVPVAPSYVFVVEDMSTQITVVQSSALPPSRNVISCTMQQGRLMSVQLDDDCQVYVGHFPMTPTLIQNLQIPGTPCALYHLQAVGGPHFVATHRSTIVVSPTTSTQTTTTTTTTLLEPPASSLRVGSLAWRLTDKKKNNALQIARDSLGETEENNNIYRDFFDPPSLVTFEKISSPDDIRNQAMTLATQATLLPKRLGASSCVVHELGSILVCGRLNRCESSRHFRVSDSQTRLPMITTRALSVTDGTTLVLKLEYLVVSIVCVGQGEEGRTVSLPSIDHTNCTFLFCQEGFIFVASMYIYCSDLRSECETEDDKRVVPLQDCLSAEGLAEPKENTVTETLLVRKHLRTSRSREGKYSGMSITLSQLDNTEASTVSCIQNIDLRPSIYMDTKEQILLRQFLARNFETVFEDEQLTLIHLWWLLGSRPEQCALLSGGWEECLERSSTFGIKVSMLASLFVVDQKRGYSRVRCSITSLIAEPALILSNGRRALSSTAEKVVHFVTQKKLLSGSLDRRPSRVQKHFESSNDCCRELAFGELIKSPNVPVVEIRDIVQDMCIDICHKSMRMAPSLVRSVKNARFLGVSYCAVTAQCSKCYNLLQKPKHRESPDRRQGVKSSVQLYNETLEAQPSFYSPRKKQKRVSTLVCPEGCDVERFGSIKWECSGTIDDGTGQAKLFAEREVAVSLLGLTASEVKAIEAGAWTREVVFNRSLPPPSHLKPSIQTAKFLAVNGRRRLQESDILNYLTDYCRAEYLLHRHCRFSKFPLRPLSYLVRVKPLSDQESNCLHPTEIELSIAGLEQEALSKRTLSYALPVLKLNLLDLILSC